MKEIYITEHVCLRFIERFNQNLGAIADYTERLIRAKEAIKTVVEDARYVSDNEGGVLLYSRSCNCNIIIKDRKLITIFPPVKKTLDREKKAASWNK